MIIFDYGMKKMFYLRMLHQHDTIATLYMNTILSLYI